MALLLGDLHLFERLFVIGLENNKDCDITMPLSLKTMEVQIKGNQWKKMFRTVWVICCQIASPLQRGEVWCHVTMLAKSLDDNNREL